MREERGGKQIKAEIQEQSQPGAKKPCGSRWLKYIGKRSLGKGSPAPELERFRVGAE